MNQDTGTSSGVFDSGPARTFEVQVISLDPDEATDLMKVSKIVQEQTAPWKENTMLEVFNKEEHLQGNVNSPTIQLTPKRSYRESEMKSYILNVSRSNQGRSIRVSTESKFDPEKTLTVLLADSSEDVWSLTFVDLTGRLSTNPGSASDGVKIENSDSVHEFLVNELEKRKMYAAEKMDSIQ